MKFSHENKILLFYSLINIINTLARNNKKIFSQKYIMLIYLAEVVISSCMAAIICALVFTVIAVNKCLKIISY